MQMSLFDFGLEQTQAAEVELPSIPELDTMDLLRMEKESIGFYVSGHPLDKYTEQLKPIINHRLTELPELADRTFLRVAGLVTQLQNRLTKKGDSMAIFTLEDKLANVRCVCFPKAYAEARQYLADGVPVLLNGRLQVEDEDRLSLIVDSVFALEGMDFLEAPKGQELPAKQPEENGGKYPRRRQAEPPPEKPKATVYVRVPDSTALADIRRLAGGRAGMLEVVPYYNDIRRYQRGLGILVDNETVDLYKVHFGEDNVVLKVH